MTVIKNWINKENEEVNLVSKNISKILGLEIWKLEIEEQKKWSSFLIDGILKKYSKHKKLAKYLLSEVDSKYFSKLDINLRSDKEIILVAIRASSDNYKFIADNLKTQDFVAYEIIKSFIREDKNYFEINTFIDTNFLKLKKDLLKFYKKQLNKIDRVLSDDLTKNLIYLNENNIEFFELLKNNKIVIGKWNKINVNPNFINDLEKYFHNNDDYKLADIEWKKQIKFNYLMHILWVNGIYINNELSSILYSIIGLCNLKQDKKNIEKKVKEEKYDSENFDDEDDNNIKDWKIKNNDDDIFSDKLDYCLPNYTYTYSWWWYYINSPSNIPVIINEEEKNNFTSKALQNFIKFYSKLYKLWLSFLWDKYKTKFITLANNKFGLDYLNWDGITAWKTLSVLNLIWKNIWVPEKEIIWEDQKPLKEIKCFKTLWEAELKFEGIKSSSMINGEFIQTGIWTWVVEKKLHLERKIDIIKGDLFMNNW